MNAQQPLLINRVPTPYPQIASPVSDPKQNDERSDTKRSGAKRSGAKRSGAKRSGAKRSGSKRRGAKRSGAKRSGSKRSGSKRRGDKRSAKRSGAKRRGDKRSAKRSAAKRSAAKRSGSKRRGDKRSAKRSGAKRSGAKRSHRKRSGDKRSQTNIYSVENMMRYFYEMTVKNLSNENKASINIDKSKGMMYGTASREELVKMPWMYCVKPLWSVAPGPYTFRINFEGGKKGEKIKKTLSIYNGTVNLFPTSSILLNDILSKCSEY